MNWKRLQTSDQWLILIVALGILIRFCITFFVYPVGDSTWHLAVARFIAEEGSIPLFEGLGRFAFWAPPLFHLHLAAQYLLFSGIGLGQQAMAFVAPLYGSLTLIVFALFSRMLTSSRTAIFSTFFLACIPFHIYYSTLSHVDIVIGFFALFSLYLLLKGKWVWSAIFAGLGMLTKYNMLFMFPLFLFLICLQEKTWVEKIKKNIWYFIILFAVGIPWYIRNILAFGNPLYPFLNGLLIKIGIPAFVHDLGFATAPTTLLGWGVEWSQLYLDLFGVPLGRIENLSFLPFGVWGIALWFLFVTLFFIPILVGLFKKKTKEQHLIIWTLLGSFFLLLLLYLLDYGTLYFRLALPLIFSLALLWGMGTSMLMSKATKPLRIFLIVFLLGSAIVFTVGEGTKAIVAASLHEDEEQDYAWARVHLPEDALLTPPSGTLAYHTERRTVPFFEEYDEEKVYYWVLPETNINVTGKLIVYNNAKTGLVIYH